MTFQVGDIVKLHNGEAHQRVTKIENGGRHISTQYLNTRHMQIFRRAGDFRLVESTQPKSHPKEDPMPNQNSLYQTKEEKPRYGNYIATNPEGRIVLAMDTGYEDFDADKIEEVIPHTVEIKFQDGRTHHYSIPAGKLAVADIVVMGVHLGRVTKIDTKNRSPKPEPKDLRKVGTSPV